MRTMVGTSAVVALAVVATACSGGGSHVSARRHGADSTTSSSIARPRHSAKSTVSKKHQKKKPKGEAVGHTSTSLGYAVNANGTVTVPIIGAPGDTLPPASAPTTAAAAPATSATTTTVYTGPKPYDPTKPIDLSGVPGVTPAEQARAEQLVRDTLRDLPKYADLGVAYAAGYRSIGDGFTGDDHFVNWAYMNDNHILDSKYPESLLYEARNGKETLVAAMYSLNLGSTFADVPDIGGPLTQWHVHDDLCLKDNPKDPLQKLVSSLTGVNGQCPAGSTKAGSAPMIHVWIVANKCGPFAGLEGIGAGQVPPGETPYCDTAHGSG